MHLHIFQSFSHIDIREGCQKNTVWLVFLRLSVVCLGSKLVARGSTVYLVESFHGTKWLAAACIETSFSVRWAFDQWSEHFRIPSVSAAAMHVTCFLAILGLGLSLVTAASSVGTLEVTENRCEEESQACIPRQRCASYNESIAQIRKLAAGSQEHTELVGQLRKLVCNKEKRGICCRTENEEPQNVFGSNSSHSSGDENKEKENVGPDREPKPTQIEDDNEERVSEGEEEEELELYPPPLSGPRPRWAPDAAKCCKWVPCSCDLVLIMIFPFHCKWVT